MTNKELSLEIRNILKVAGIKRTDLSVKVSDAGYSTAIHIKIKNPEISRRMVEDLVKGYNQVERDEFNGEVLEGSNQYLFVEYEYGLFNRIIDEYIETANNAINSITETNTTVKIFDGLLYYQDQRTGEKRLMQEVKNDRCSRTIYDINELSEYIYRFVKLGSITA